MVTHSSTSRPVQCLCMAERTGCPVFTDLWSYVKVKNHVPFLIIDLRMLASEKQSYDIRPVNPSYGNSPSATIDTLWSNIQQGF
jgi:hypothetical protein